jgi:uncharacterized Tic20 family protein
MAKKTSKPEKPANAVEEQPQTEVEAGPRQRAAHLTNEEMTWAALAHASVLLGIASGGMAGVASAFLIWLAYRDRSNYVAFQAMQSLAFQLAWAGATFLAALVAALSVVTICLIPLGLVLLIAVIAVPIAALVYGLYAAYETYYGADFLYWKVGEFVAQQMGEQEDQE